MNLIFNKYRNIILLSVLLVIFNFSIWIIYFINRNLSSIGDAETAIVSSLFNEIIFFIIFVIINLFVIVNKQIDFLYKRRMVFYINLPYILYFSIGLFNPIAIFVGMVISKNNISPKLEFPIYFISSGFMNILLWRILVRYIIKDKSIT